MNKYVIKIFAFALLTFVLGISQSCKTGALGGKETSAEDLKVLDSIYQLDNYRIEIDVVYPFNTLATTQVANDLLWNTGNNASRIDVRADGNYIQIRNDSLTGYLPFFGERRLNGGDISGRNSAIQFDEFINNLNKSINKKKNRVELNFTAKQKEGDNDKYDTKIYIYPNKSVLVDISPVYRTFMKYEGRLVEITE